MTLDELNQSSVEDARKALSACCSSSVWQDQMLSLRPFKSEAGLKANAEKIWLALSEKDWLEGFKGHPRIGDKEAIRKKLTLSGAWSQNEQAKASQAPELVLAELAKLNDMYFDKFGFVFLIFATGKTAEQMLDALKARINNSRKEELAIAAAEHNKITLLRLGKLLGEN